MHLAKAVGSEAYVQACDHAHEVHAGVASMTEYGLTLHTTASRTLYSYLGDPRFHRRRLADALRPLALKSVCYFWLPKRSRFFL